jgi:hypothetical protein
MQSLVPRRLFLKHAALAGISAAPLFSCGMAAAGDGSSYPLLRWDSVEDIRRQEDGLWKLTDLINAYRRRNRLPEAALSPRLTAVALAHVHDLIRTRPHAAGNLHSWSRAEHWTGGEYLTDDKSTWPIMWEKPREIAGYDGLGFEIAAANVDDPEHALRAWWASPSHLDVILSRGVWSKPRWRWRALGAVFQEGYACAWFGAEEDR